MNEEARDHVAEPGVDRVPKDPRDVSRDLSGIGDGNGDKARGAISRQREWQLANPEAAKAHELLNQAVRSGTVARPESCSICGVGCVPHGHHSDYSRPLFVAWVCEECHAGIHVMLRQRASPPGPAPLPTVPSEAAALLGRKGGAAGRGAAKRRDVDYAALGKLGGRPRRPCESCGSRPAYRAGLCTACSHAVTVHGALRTDAHMVECDRRCKR